MSVTNVDLQAIVEDLKQKRDQVQVQLHLAKAEAKDEWEALEQKWEHLRGKMRVLGHEAGEAADQVGAALRLTADELRRGYERISRLL